MPKRKLTSRLTPKKDWRDVFIDALSLTPNVSGAARRAGISRQAAYQERDKDEGFRLAWKDAIEQSLDHAEGEMYRRAVEGVDIPHYDKDSNLLFTEKRYSDTLLIFMLKSHRPSVYRETFRVEHDIAGELLRLAERLNLSASDIASDPLLSAFFGAANVKVKDGTD